MSAKRSTRPFHPWRSGLLVGAALLIVGALVIVWYPGHPCRAAVSGLILMLAGQRLLASAWARLHGKWVERRAIRQLNLPEGWSARANVALHSGGDIDLLLVRDSRVRFAIEIKAARKPILDSWSSSSKKPLRQVIRAARELSTIPVLWLPRARRRRALVLSDDVIVIHGNASWLRQELL